MNGMLSITEAYELDTNIYDDVKNFQVQENHEEGFKQVMKCLQECVMMQNMVDDLEVESTFVLRSQNNCVTFRAEVKNEYLKITSIDYYDEDEENEIREFIQERDAQLKNHHREN